MRMLRIFVALVAATGFWNAAVVAQEPEPLIVYDSQFHPTLAKHGMVVSQEYYASEAGLEILKKGGNAVDAAVATAFAMAVTHPQAGNLGGGGFMMIYLEKEDRVIALDYREMAPAAAHRDMFLNENGDVDKKRVRFTLKASGVPGTVMGLTTALKKYGSLPLDVVMAPAIRLAGEGFPMTWGLYDSLGQYQSRLKADAESAKNYFKADGSRYEPDEIFRQPDLANTLKLIAAKGADGFYDGPVADKLVAAMTEQGGIMTKDDLKHYRAVERTPVEGTYRGYKIVTMPPPSSGGVHVVQMLNVFEGWDMASLGHNSAAYIHRLAETMKYAYADRSKYLGDPDFVDVPVAGLTSKNYAASIRGKINLEHATPSTEIAPAPSLPDESHDTTHFSIMDAAGNMVANTYTLNFTYGNGKSVPGAGFLMNNEMDDFSAKAGVPNAFGLLGGDANAIEPGKRPLSSMTPTFVFKDGEPFMATGSPGGSLIITVTMQTILNVIDFGMNGQAAVSVPRVHHQWFPDRLFMEPGHSVDTRRMLGEMGHEIRTEPSEAFDSVLGSAQVIVKLPNGIISGAADPRRPGAHAAGY